MSENFASLDPVRKDALTAHLGQFVTPHKRGLMDDVLSRRTRRLTVVLEDLYQPHNASACLRSCECFGVQDVHIIEIRNEYQVNSEVALGASKWLNLHRHRAPDSSATRACLDKLRGDGYQIVATALRDDALPLPDLPVEGKTALCFGTEEDGLSATALEMADAFVKIPMFGFTQSFNISVSLALCLHDFCSRLRRAPEPWALSEEEQRDLRLEWYMRVVRNADVITRTFLRTAGEG